MSFAPWVVKVRGGLVEVAWGLVWVARGLVEVALYIWPEGGANMWRVSQLQWSRR